ncbi:MAG: hypothetical protein KDA75_21230 [Planctomycetaceae bacterium]|nr:hypothetical protein [Planctomycetaceae bacterium]
MSEQVWQNIAVVVAVVWAAWHIARRMFGRSHTACGSSCRGCDQRPQNPALVSLDPLIGEPKTTGR